MATVAKRPVILTPKFRVAFPQIEQAMIVQPGQKARPAGPGEKGRFSLTALFEIASFTDKEKAQWKQLIDACNAASVETFKKPMKDLDRAAFKTPFHKGEEKAESYAGFGPGIYFCSMSAYQRRPVLLAANGVDRLEPSALYPGCYARASVNPFAYNNVGKGIAIGLNNVQFMADGERLDGATTAEEDFGTDPIEFGEDTGLETSEDELAF